MDVELGNEMKWSNMEKIIIIGWNPKQNTLNLFLLALTLEVTQKHILLIGKLMPTS